MEALADLRCQHPKHPRCQSARQRRQPADRLGPLHPDCSDKPGFPEAVNTGDTGETDETHDAGDTDNTVCSARTLPGRNLSVYDSSGRYLLEALAGLRCQRPKHPRCQSGRQRRQPADRLDSLHPDCSDKPGFPDTVNTDDTTETGDTTATTDAGETGDTRDTHDAGETGDTTATTDAGETGDTRDTTAAGDTDDTTATGETDDTTDAGDTHDTTETGDTHDTTDTANASDTVNTSDTRDTAYPACDLPGRNLPVYGASGRYLLEALAGARCQRPKHWRCQSGRQRRQPADRLDPLHPDGTGKSSLPDTVNTGETRSMSSERFWVCHRTV